MRLDKLQKNHLKLRDTINRPDFMKGSVLEQLYNSSRVSPATKVPWGSRITLVIGAGVEAEPVLVPNLIGLTFAEAKQVLQEKGISLAAVVPMPDVKDTLNAFVYRQTRKPEILMTSDFIYNRDGQWIFGFLLGGLIPIV